MFFELGYDYPSGIYSRKHYNEDQNFWWFEICKINKGNPPFTDEVLYVSCETYISKEHAQNGANWYIYNNYVKKSKGNDSTV